MKRQCVELFGVPVDALTMDQTVERMRAWVHSGQECQHVVINAAKIVQLSRDPSLANAVRQCELVSADGMSVVWASRLLGCPLPGRVTGIDLMEGLIEAAAEDGHSVYFLGAQPAIVARMVAILQGRYPALVVAGYHHGYWQNDGEVIERIRAARPDYLFVGLPSPKKELWLQAHREELKVPALMGVGGSFDVIAGHHQRAPNWVGRFGLEWTWRLGQEPRRMWRRYLVGNTHFLVLLLRECFRRRGTASLHSAT